MIDIVGLKHEYRDADNKVVKALNGINLTIAEGEFVAIIGANGSGKSTLARHLNALLLPSEGKVMVDGLDTAAEENLWEIRRRVGMVFQNPDNQIVAALVEEDVAFGPENIGVPSKEIAERVRQALATVGMGAYAKHAPHLLSGGQKQRVAIAGILALSPRYIVLDEATAMLDPRGRAEIVATVRQLNRDEGITIIYITHNMAEALLADRVLVMAAGQICLDGRPAEIFSQVQELKAWGLEAPLAARVALKLRQNGLKLPLEIVEDRELAEALCR